MYFAATRSLVTRQIKPWTLQLQYNGASKPGPSTTKHSFQPLISRFRHENSFVVSTMTIGTLQCLTKSFLYSPLKTNTSTSMSYMKGEIECPSFSVTPGCLPTDINSVSFTRKEDDDLEKKIKEIIGENKTKFDVNLNAYSLVTLRRKIKSENLKDPGVPPGWKKRK